MGTDQQISLGNANSCIHQVIYLTCCLTGEDRVSSIIVQRGNQVCGLVNPFCIHRQSIYNCATTTVLKTFLVSRTRSVAWYKALYQISTFKDTELGSAGSREMKSTNAMLGLAGHSHYRNKNGMVKANSSSITSFSRDHVSMAIMMPTRAFLC